MPPTSRKIMTMVETRFTDPAFSVAMFARRLGVSVSYLRELVYREWQTNPTALIERFRVQEAIRHLRTRKLPIQDVSRAVGYASPRSFRGAFRRHFGISPVEYRRRALAARVRPARRRAA